MRGFLGTAAALIFAFSLVTAMYTFMLTNNDVAAPARVGLAVESARWAVEADVFNCSNPSYNGATYYGATRGSVEVAGDKSNASYSTGFMNMKVHLERNYAPSANLTSSGTTLSWQACDIEGISTCTLYGNGEVVLLGCPGSHSGDLEGSSGSTYYVKVTDSNGNTGYSNKVTV